MFVEYIVPRKIPSKFAYLLAFEIPLTIVLTEIG